MLNVNECEKYSVPRSRRTWYLLFHFWRM